MPTKTVSPGITRFDLDEKKVHGFMVRLCRQGNHINEFFSDLQCGGKRKARKQADARYAELLDEYGPAQASTKNKVTSRNSSGKVGVHLSQTPDKTSPDYVYEAYCASWVNANGSRGKINFACSKYGKKNAWELACLARELESNDREAILAKHEKQKLRKKKPTKKKTKQR